MAVLGIDGLRLTPAFFFMSLSRIPMKQALIALSLLSIASFACIEASEPLSKKLKTLAESKQEVEALPSSLAAQGGEEAESLAVEGGPCAKKTRIVTEDNQGTYEELLNKATGRPLESLTHDLLSEEQTIWDHLPKDVANFIAQKVNSHSGVPDFIFEHLKKEVRMPNTEDIILHVGAANMITWSGQKKVITIRKRDCKDALSVTLNRQPFISRDGNTMVMEQRGDPNSLTFKVFDLERIWELRKLIFVAELHHEGERDSDLDHSSFLFTNIKNTLYTETKESFKVWNVKTGTCLFTGKKDECRILSFGGRMMVIEYGPKSRAKYYDHISVQTKETTSWHLQHIDDGTSYQLPIPETLLGGRGTNIHAALSKSGDTLALTGNGSLVIYNVEDLMCLHYLEDLKFYVRSESDWSSYERSPFDLESEDKSLRFSSTGNKLLLADDGEVGIFDVKHGILSQRKVVPLVDNNSYFLGRSTFNRSENLLIVPISNENVECCYLTILDIESGTWLGIHGYFPPRRGEYCNVGVAVRDNVILLTSTGLSWNLKKRLEILQKIKKLTLKQHQILNCIYRVCIAARVLAVKKIADMCDFMTQSGYDCERINDDDGDHAYQQALMNDVECRLSEINFGFDFNRYPIETQLAYDALPPEIRSHFDRYVIRHKETPTNNS